MLPGKNVPGLAREFAAIVSSGFIQYIDKAYSTAICEGFSENQMFISAILFNFNMLYYCESRLNVFY
jgi:hypothetical protein